uniref:Uncharacterized protein n=1 Tax=Chrysotila carterae TaxID=13221 RepID=A0A7S4F6E2_CHRCT
MTLSEASTPVRSGKPSSFRRLRVRSKEDLTAEESAACRQIFVQASAGAETVDSNAMRLLLRSSPAARRLVLTERMVDDFIPRSSVSPSAAPRSPAWQKLPFLPSKAKENPKEGRFTCGQFLKANAEMHKYFEAQQQKGVVIVGNGRSVLASTAGPTIDRFATVIRFNEYQLRGYERHVGTKTTLWVLSDYTCVQLINKYPDRKMPILVAIPFRMMGKPYYADRVQALRSQLSHLQLKRITFIPAETSREIIQAYEFGQRWPSSGMIAIWHFLQDHPEVVLHGFDFFKEIDGKIHYMEDSHKANHDSKQEENICHDLVRDKRVRFVI